jgi:hypothetical protein
MINMTKIVMTNLLVAVPVAVVRQGATRQSAMPQRASTYLPVSLVAAVYDIYVMDKAAVFTVRIHFLLQALAISH